MSDVAQFEAAKLLHRTVFGRGAAIGGAYVQGNAKLLDFLQGHISAAIKRHVPQHPGKRSHEIKNRDNIATHSSRLDVFEIGHNEQKQTDSDEQKQVCPRLRDNETHLRGDVVHLVRLSGEVNIIGKEHPAAIAMELQ